MKFDGEIIKFNLFDAMKYPADNYSVCSIDILNEVVQDVFETSGKDELESVIQHGVIQSTLQGDYQWSEELEETVMALNSLQLIPERYTLAPFELEIPNTKLLPSVVQPPVLELVEEN